MKMVVSVVFIGLLSSFQSVVASEEFDGFSSEEERTALLYLSMRYVNSALNKEKGCEFGVEHDDARMDLAGFLSQLLSGEKEKQKRVLDDFDEKFRSHKVKIAKEKKVKTSCSPDSYVGTRALDREKKRARAKVTSFRSRSSNQPAPQQQVKSTASSQGAPESGGEFGGFSSALERKQLLWISDFYAASAFNRDKGCEHGMTYDEAKANLTGFLGDILPDDTGKRARVLSAFESEFAQLKKDPKARPKLQQCQPEYAVSHSRIEKIQARHKIKMARQQKLKAERMAEAGQVTRQPLPKGPFSGVLPVIDCDLVENKSYSQLPKAYATTDVYAARCKGSDTKYFYHEMQSLVEKYSTDPNASPGFQRELGKLESGYQSGEFNVRRLTCQDLERSFVYGKDGGLLADEARKSFVCYAQRALAVTKQANEEAALKKKAAEAHAAKPVSERKQEHQEESKEFLAMCEGISSNMFSETSDCHCLQKKFVEYRIKNGPKKTIGSVWRAMQSDPAYWKSCLAQDSAINYLKQNCGQILSMDVMVKKRTQSEVDSICDCFSRNALDAAKEPHTLGNPFSDHRRYRKFSSPVLVKCSTKG
jgi:hypothetical protein